MMARAKNLRTAPHVEIVSAPQVVEHVEPVSRASVTASAIRKKKGWSARTVRQTTAVAMAFAKG